MNDVLTYNACSTLVRKVLEAPGNPTEPVLLLWTNQMGEGTPAGAPGLGFWEITVRKIADAELSLASAA